MTDEDLLESIGIPCKFDADIMKALDATLARSARIEAMPEGTEDERLDKGRALRKLVARIERLHRSQTVRNEMRQMRAAMERKD